VVTRKGDLSVALYFSTMRGYVDEMAAAGKVLDDDDIVSYILNGLDVDYNSLLDLSALRHCICVCLILRLDLLHKRCSTITRSSINW
jgi:hypothetical protein